jgi:dihydrofolate reductase
LTKETNHELKPPESDLPSGLAKPAQRALSEAGFVRLEQLTRVSEGEVLKLHGMGPKALDQLRRALAEKGMAFADASKEEGDMGKVIVGATMSLDGFIADRNGDVSRLYPDLEALRKTEALQESIRTTGAVLMGRRAYAMGEPDSYVDDYEYQVPIFVLTHNLPEKSPKQSERLTFTFVTDGIESAIRQAKAAAGDKNVTVVGGASTVQQCINAGLADELHIDIKPLLLGEGLRLFEHLGPEPIELEIINVMESPDITHLRFRMVKGN